MSKRIVASFYYRYTQDFSPINDDAYTPLLAVDQIGNEYCLLTKYEAGALRPLLRLMSEAGFASGDWFTDIPTKIPEDWETPHYAQELMRQLAQRLSKAEANTDVQENATGED